MIKNIITQQIINLINENIICNKTHTLYFNIIFGNINN